MIGITISTDDIQIAVCFGRRWEQIGTRWVDLGSVVQADFSTASGRPVLRLVLTAGTSGVEVTDLDQIVRVARALGLEGCPELGT